MIPEKLKKFIEDFSSIPGLGPRQATRVGFYLVKKGKDFILGLSKSIVGLAELSVCERCFFVGEGRLCGICLDKKRDFSVIAIVEKETDIFSLERAGVYRGGYFVLGESKRKGVLDKTQEMRLIHLKNLIKSELGGRAKEIIIATNPDTWGDLLANSLKKELKDFSLSFTRLGKGIPVGGEIEFADEETLRESLSRRSRL